MKLSETTKKELRELLIMNSVKIVDEIEKFFQKDKYNYLSLKDYNKIKSRILDSQFIDITEEVKNGQSSQERLH